MSLDLCLLFPPGYGFDGEPWTPLDDDDLLAWFDPSIDVHKVAADDTEAAPDETVEEWIRRAGSAAITATRSTESQRPTLKQAANLRRYLRTDGADDGMRTGYTTAFARGITVGVQFRSQDGGSHDQYPCVVSKASGNGGEGWLLGFKGLTRRFGVTSPNVAEIAYDTTELDDATWYRGIMTVSSDANATYKIYVDGAEVASATTTNGQHNAADELALFEDYTAGIGSWKGDVGHIALFDREFDAADVAKLDAFLLRLMPSDS